MSLKLENITKRVQHSDEALTRELNTREANVESTGGNGKICETSADRFHGPKKDGASCMHTIRSGQPLPINMDASKY